TYLRGRAEAWPFTSEPSSTLLVVDDLHAAPGELAQAIDAYRCRGISGPAILVTAREAPRGAATLSLGPLGDAAMKALGARLGASEVASAAGNPGWLVAAAGRIPLTKDTALERLKGLPASAKIALAHVATAGGSLDEEVLRRLGCDARASGLLSRSRRGGRTLWSLPAMHLASDLAAALADFETADDLAEALLDIGVPAGTYLAAARAPSPPSRREELLAAAIEAAKRDGERSLEIDALLALVANPKQRTGARLARLER